jgi:hypothetical protein
MKQCCNIDNRCLYHKTNYDRKKFYDTRLCFNDKILFIVVNDGEEKIASVCYSRITSAQPNHVEVVDN